MYHIIVYYNFNHIADPERFCSEQKDFCRSLGMKGRVYIAEEGINGTLSGTPESIQTYIEAFRSTPGFADTEFKAHEGDMHVFADLRVKTRPEIVALKKPIHHDPKTEGGKRLSPKEWREVLESNKEYTLIDVRNNYESEIGHFEGAILPDVENFYDFPQWLDEQKLDKGKKVLMYCTGGIRCEKFSVYMQEQGFKDVNQLQGGILNYANEEDGAHYKGKCFVFDDRLAVKVDENQEEPLSRCAITGVPCDTYINCANMECNKLFLCSREGAVKMEGCCGEECMASIHRRPFNLKELYIPFRRWYKYFEEDDKKSRVVKQSN